MNNIKETSAIMGFRHSVEISHILSNSIYYSVSGLMTKALSDLVVRLNGEDVLTEGLMKFNAFVFGLLK